jgi:quercetin dioxygenase-like cupin family protein
LIMRVRVHLPDATGGWSARDVLLPEPVSIDSAREQLRGMEEPFAADARLILNGREASGSTLLQDGDHLAFWSRDDGGSLIEHGGVPIVPSPSGLPTQHLINERNGSTGLFVGQQWLQPGERVYLHTHPCDEALTYLSGTGEATLGEAIVPIGPGRSLFIPTGLLHGFRNTGNEVMHVMVFFPVPYFAPTGIVDEADRRQQAAESREDEAI